MRLIALLCWYDEPTAWLAELVSGLAKAQADHVVAVDGAFMLYPDAKGASPAEQAQVIVGTALGAGMGVTVHTLAHPWLGNETEKRSAAFRLAHEVAEPREDWIWVCDGDETIQTAYGLKQRLADTACDVAEVTLVEPRKDGQFPLRKLFRAHQDGIRVEHWHGRYVDGDDRVLWDNLDMGNQVDAADCWDTRVVHRSAERSLARLRARKEYYSLRDDLGAERVPA